MFFSDISKGSHIRTMFFFSQIKTISGVSSIPNEVAVSIGSSIVCRVGPIRHFGWNIFPLFQKELSQRLLEEAQRRAIDEYSKSFHKMITAGGFQPSQVTAKQLQKRGVRIMTCNFGLQASEPSYCCVIDRDGEVIAHLRLDFITRDSKNEDYKKDEAKLSDFIKIHQPDVIGINAQIESRRMYEKLRTIQQRIDKESMHLTYVPTDIAKLYATSKRAASQYPDYAYGLLIAISVGT